MRGANPTPLCVVGGWLCFVLFGESLTVTRCSLEVLHVDGGWWRGLVVISVDVVWIRSQRSTASLCPLDLPVSMARHFCFCNCKNCKPLERPPGIRPNLASISDAECQGRKMPISCSLMHVAQIASMCSGLGGGMANNSCTRKPQLSANGISPASFPLTDSLKIPVGGISPTMGAPTVASQGRGHIWPPHNAASQVQHIRAGCRASCSGNRCTPTLEEGTKDIELI